MSASRPASPAQPAPSAPRRSRHGPGPLRGAVSLALVGGSLALVGGVLCLPAQASPGSEQAAHVLAWDPEHTPLEASATLAPDGSYTLVMLPEGPWSQASLSVSGDGSFELGPTDGSAPVEVQGVRDQQGPLWVQLDAVTPDDHGISWSFEVQPELLPTPAPDMPPRAGHRRRHKRGGPR